MRAAVVSTAAAVLVGALGIVGLARGAVPQGASSSSSSTPDMSGMSMGMNSGGAAGSISITGAYVRQPASPDVAAAYFTIHNEGSAPDTLQSVQTGAGQQADLHTSAGTTMADMPNGLTIPAHGTVVLTAGSYHVMIEKPIGAIKAGQTVNLQLFFAKAGPIDVAAPVIAILAPAPTEGATK
jgi:copper(I)-binding protein